MRNFPILVLSMILFLSCKKKEDEVIVDPCVPDNYLYYSDYFVFVADDGGTPLVVPIDVNWTPGENGYLGEYKGWYGTTGEWPIAYQLNDTTIDLCKIPQEAWEHSNGEYFQFDINSRELITTIWGAPELRLTIPESSEWIKTPAEEDKEIYGCKTIVKVDGSIRSGWLIYERIRWSEPTVAFGDFESFYWIPVVVDNVFYHFSQHQGVQTASRWEDSEGIVTVSTIPAFDLAITEISTDASSGRDSIPEVVEINAPDWGISIKMKSGGSQIGYGPEFPKGLAYYRQSLLQTTADSEDEGYGMFELILENN